MLLCDVVGIFSIFIPFEANCQLEICYLRMVYCIRNVAVEIFVKALVLVFLTAVASLPWNSPPRAHTHAHTHIHIYGERWGELYIDYLLHYQEAYVKRVKRHTRHFVDVHI